MVVSTLPPGAADALAGALASAGGVVRGVLLDCAYDPRPTALTRVWRELGGTAVGGERMLLHQAAEQVRLMTGHAAPVECDGTRARHRPGLIRHPDGPPVGSVGSHPLTDPIGLQPLPLACR